MASVNLERGEGERKRKELQVSRRRGHKWDTDVPRRGFVCPCQNITRALSMACRGGYGGHCDPVIGTRLLDPLPQKHSRTFTDTRSRIARRDRVTATRIMDTRQADMEKSTRGAFSISRRSRASAAGKNVGRVRVAKGYGSGNGVHMGLLLRPAVACRRDEFLLCVSRAVQCKVGVGQARVGSSCSGGLQ
ncbi:uncharacterized protein K460DRAFT_393672 [Cucurbitaria berberidis CBS 394.84]|uniref:Uncharacterized protein n=1 Tax=Cucurbitaria berberidis CBS 394.84 TaxID=1168544 RepID=A0A9P4LBZ0_9PLEO|nr:uncharacterized protein K460DRAFT_393672 [Cucurbitaria berberidis CBS 394.84]KAF1848629.1 hypothetical protein K460DRAFT_393672 [Cucurbitaria berberidis CBS 394.84]